MTRGRAVLLDLLLAGMELCWLYGWAAFSLAAAMGAPFPLVQAVEGFVLAALITRFSLIKPLRVISVLGLQVLGFACAALSTVHAVYYPSYPLLARSWLLASFSAHRTPVEWVVLLFVLVWVVALWACGVRFARRSKGYYTVCSRFDIGLTAFFALFLLRFAAEAKGGMAMPDTSGLLVFPFLLLGLLAAGAARSKETPEKEYAEGYRAVGLAVSAASAVLLSAGCLALLFLPWLASVARVGQRALKSAAGPLGPAVEGLLRFLFIHGRVLPGPPQQASVRGGGWHTFMPAKGYWWMELLEKVLWWALCLAGTALLLTLFAILLALLGRWLLSRTGADGRRMEPKGWSAWLRAVLRWLSSFRKSLGLVFTGCDGAADYYRALGRWATRSGLRPMRSETPTEFGLRLKLNFPRLEAPIDVIVRAFNREVYGEIKLPGEWHASMLSAWRVLRSPAHWPRRLRCRLSGGRSTTFC